MCKFRKSTYVYFKYTSDPEKKIQIHFKNRFKVYWKYTSLLNF